MCWLLLYEAVIKEPAADIVQVAFVVADVEEAAFVVTIADGVAADAAACCDDEVKADVAADVDGPESVASTGLSHELLLLQGCE